MLAGPIPNGFTLPATTLPATPTPADLAATEDIVLTPAIQALALNHNPVTIYNWVRNTIEYLPTYGSIQGADMTLQTKKGNSFDTASLLIALLRASNIPARYVYGTIQIPADQAMNWVGGVSKPEAAQQLMGQGGIPNIGMISGGVVKTIKLEHVWVEAYVDYVPSRGAVNRTPDSWIPLDASYKQYTYTQGMDLKTAVPLDAQALVTQAQSGATIDPAGWVQNLNGTAIQTALTGYQTQVQNYINTTKPNATVGDVIGSKTIIVNNSSILAGTLPYTKIATGGKFTELPAVVRHTVSIDLYADAMSKALGSPSLSYSISLPALGGRRLGVTYQPASAADAQLIQSYQALGAASLPVYLLRVVPAIQVDGVTVASGFATTMGMAQMWDATLADPQNLNTKTESFDTAAGDEMVFGLNGNGITPEVIQQRFATNPADTAAENLFQIAMHYWMEYDLFDDIIAKRYQVHKLRMPSIGLFASPLSVSYFFGIPRSGAYKGRYMDVKRSLLAVVGEDPQAKLGFISQSGIQGSYLEGTVFDQLLERQRGAGISAVQLLLDANVQGIPIRTITQDNVSTEFAKLSISVSARDDILNYVNAGKIVTVPERDVTHLNWRGIGYIAQDPVVGTGAYMVDGGLNGGASESCKPEVVPLAKALKAIVVTAIIIEIVLVALILAPVIVGVAASATEAVAGLSTVVRTLMVAMGVSFLAFPAAASDNNPYACECELKLESDDAACVAIAGARYGPSGIKSCQSSAMRRYSECLRGGVGAITSPLSGVETPL